MPINPNEIEHRVANAFARRIQDPIEGVIQGGTSPLGGYTIPVRIEGQVETLYAKYNPVENATILAEGTRVKLIYNDIGELEILDWDRAAARASYPNPPPSNLVLQQHNHQNAAGGGQLNASLIFSAGTVPVNRGGTGIGVYAVGDLVYASTTGVLSRLAVGSNGNVYHVAGGVPVSGTLNLDTANLSGTLAYARGGLNVDVSAFTDGSIVIKGTTTASGLAPGTSGNLAQSNGTAWASVAPSFNANVITAGQLALARGGTNADLSATGPGFLHQLTAGANVSNLKANFAGTAAPTVNEDSGDGYAVGSLWIDTTNDHIYQATDVTVGAAVWLQLDGSGGSSPFTTTSNVIHPNVLTDNFSLGTTSNLGKLAVVGDADETQFLVRPYFLQSGNIMVVEDPAGNAAFAIDAVGGFKVNISQTSTASFQAYGENDSSLFATSPTNDRVGVGITSPDSRFEVRGWADEIQTIIRANGTQTSDIFRITTSAPATLLSVTNGGKLFLSGEIEIDGALNHDGSTVGFYGTTPLAQQAQTIDLKDALVAIGIIASAGGATPFNLDGGALTVGNTVIGGTFTQDAGAYVFNEAGDDHDGRFEGATDTDLVKIDAGLDMVGISEGTPTALLHIGASTTARASMRMTTGAAPTSANDGDVWNDDGQNAMMMSIAGLAGAFGKVLFTQSATKTISNTGTETTIFTTGVGSLSLPANYLTAAKTFLIIAGGHYGAMGTGGGLDIRVKLGGTTIATGQQLVGSSDDNTGWGMYAFLTCRTVGAPGTVIAQGMAFRGSTFTFLLATATTNVTTTGALALDVTADFTPTDDTLNITNAMVIELN